MRDLAASLRDVGIPYQTWSTTLRSKAARDECDGVLTPRWRFRARKYSHLIEMGDSHFPGEELGLVCFAVDFWEFETGLVQAHPYVLRKLNIIGMSDFNVKVFRQSLPADIRVSNFSIPLGAAWALTRTRQRCEGVLILDMMSL